MHTLTPVHGKRKGPTYDRRCRRRSEPSLDVETTIRRGRRSERFGRREVLWRVSENRRRRGCGRWAAGGSDGSVQVKLNDGVAHYSGLQSCGSIWSCPVCAAKVRQKRADDIELAAAFWTAAGGGLVMVTATVRHGSGDALAVTLNAVIKAWQRGVLNGAGWVADRRRFGVEGYVRSIEITFGHENGWHPHIHALIFTATALDEGQVAALAAGMGDRWNRAVMRYGAGRPSAERGFHAVAVSNAGEAAQYLAKYQDGEGRERSASLELARFDLKKGRDASRFLPFELIDQIAEGEAWALDRWSEYEAATHGRRAITWSKGFRNRFVDQGVLDVELSDDEAAAEDVGGETVIELSPERWGQIVRQRGLPARVLDVAEREGALGVGRLLLDLGHPDDHGG